MDRLGKSLKKTVVAISLAAVVLAVSAALALHRSPSAEKIREALASTTVDHIAVEEAPAGEVVTMILKSVREQHPSLRRIRVVSHPVENSGGTFDPLNSKRFTLDLRKIPANIALDYRSAAPHGPSRRMKGARTRFGSLERGGWRFVAAC